ISSPAPYSPMFNQRFPPPPYSQKLPWFLPPSLGDHSRPAPFPLFRIPHHSPSTLTSYPWAPASPRIRVYRNKIVPGNVLTSIQASRPDFLAVLTGIERSKGDIQSAASETVQSETQRGFGSSLEKGRLGLFPFLPWRTPTPPPNGDTDPTNVGPGIPT